MQCSIAAAFASFGVSSLDSGRLLWAAFFSHMFGKRALSRRAYTKEHKAIQALGDPPQPSILVNQRCALSPLPPPTDTRRATKTPVQPITQANEDRSRSIWTSSQCDAVADFHQEALVLRGAEILLAQSDELVSVLGYIEAVRSSRLHGW